MGVTMAIQLETFEQIKIHVLELLKNNPEWKARFGEYGKAIKNNSELIKNKKGQFNQRAPLYVYMPIGQAKGSMIFSLRYRGQDVAKLTVTKKGINISTKDFNENNIKFWNCKINKDGIYPWRSKDASKFRKHFILNPNREEYSEKQNNEHRIESLLLSEFSKKSKSTKLLHGIQPILNSGVARFQMSTPLKASGKINVYSGAKGGGIDILCRIRRNNDVVLGIVEVKDENIVNEPPEKALEQALSYSIFIRELLRDKECGQIWWELFGFHSLLPKNGLKLIAACAMPYGKNADKTICKGWRVVFENDDQIELHYIFFKEENNTLKELNSSWTQSAQIRSSDSPSTPSSSS
jgi:hypothetical protein